MKILAKKFTNKVPIFINAADFAKCSAAQTLLNPCAKTSLRAKRRFLRFVRKCQPSVTERTVFIAAGACHAYAKTGLDLQSTANQPVFHFEPHFPHHSKKYSAYFILPSLYHSTVLTPFLPKSSLLTFPSMTFLPGLSLSLSPSEALPLTLYESK